MVATNRPKPQWQFHLFGIPFFLGCVLTLVAVRTADRVTRRTTEQASTDTVLLQILRSRKRLSLAHETSTSSLHDHNDNNNDNDDEYFYFEEETGDEEDEEGAYVEELEDGDDDEGEKVVENEVETGDEVGKSDTNDEGDDKEHREELLPEALRVSTSQTSCCFPQWMHNQKTNETHGRCRLTCNTERACNDPYYPFATKKQAEWFQIAPKPNSTREWKHRCNAVFGRQTKPANLFEHHPPDRKWCGGGLLTPQHYHKTVPHDCISINPFGMYVLPQAKLAICLIPKVGMTEWYRFLRFAVGAVDYQGMPYRKPEMYALRMYHLPVEKQVQILNDPSWTKATFLREPSERLLSAYLHMVQNTTWEEHRLASKSLDAFVQELDERNEGPGKTKNTTTRTASPCGGFMKGGPSWCWNPHWQPQILHCGMHEYLPNFDFVGRLDRAASHTKALLEKVGIWESHGKHFLTYLRPNNPDNNKNKKKLPSTLGRMCQPPLLNLTDTSNILSGGFQQELKSKEDGHTRGASSKLDTYLGGNKETVKTIRKLFQHDYELWDALAQHPEGGWMTGKELAEQINPACKQAAVVE